MRCLWGGSQGYKQSAPCPGTVHGSLELLGASDSARICYIHSMHGEIYKQKLYICRN